MTEANLVERPLVTFALFAYNQEKYIREAVEGAFSQTYEPLEIILSDDCSSDRTFEIMQEMAAAYEGPHRVVVRRSRTNLGTLGHVLTVAHTAKGDIFVVSAGDDISLPDRVSKTVASLWISAADAYSGEDIIIDKDGSELHWDATRTTRRDNWHKDNPAWVHGATAAYKTSFLKALPVPTIKIFYEDMVFSDLMRLLERESIRSKDRLIKYRYHLENASNRVSVEESLESAEERALVRWQRARDAKNYCYNVLSSGTMEPAPYPFTHRKLYHEYKYFDAISKWRFLHLSGKFQLLYLAVLTGNMRSALPRILGKQLFFFLKRIRHD